MVKVGDVFVATWGYEQTNADFFQVVKVNGSGKSVVVRHIRHRVADPRSQSMTSTAVPIKGEFDGSPRTRMLRYSKILNNWMFNAGDSMGGAE